MAVENRSLAVIIPAYRAAGTIEKVLGAIPAYVDWIIVVNDDSPDNLDAVLSRTLDQRLMVIRHTVNCGVGGAMVSGLRQAIRLNADLIAKVDADGQMDPTYLDRLARMAVIYNCDYVKANRFGHLDALPRMPRVRYYGSIALTFMTKFASGYWNLFDPQNGYVLITRRMLRRLNLTIIDPGYFFENSMLINLNVLRAKVGEVYLPSIYQGEISSMNLWLIAKTFPWKLAKGFLYRLYQKHIFRSLSPLAILYFVGLLLLLWGGIWSAFHWYKSWTTGLAATAGTVILGLLPLLLGWISVLVALILDVVDAGPSLLLDYDDEILADSDSGRNICPK